MKKILSVLCVLLIAAFFTACEKKEKVEQKRISVIMTPDVAGIKDHAFNEFAWSGIKDYARKTDLPGKYYSHIELKNGDYAGTLEKAILKNPDLIVSAGFLWGDAVKKASKKYPKQKFIIVDMVVPKASNVESAVFAANDGSFLAGVAAGLKAKEMGIDKIGVILGMDIPLTQAFEAGYEAGAKAANPDLSVVTADVGDFGAPDKGRAVASKMYDSGVKIIYSVAGGSGKGVIEEASNRAKNGEDVWVVGVDKDQYEDGIYSTGKSVILTSMVKKVNIPVFDALKDVEGGKFTSGVKVYGLKQNAVGLPDYNPNLKSEWIETINKFKEAIEAGKIKVPQKPTRLK